MLILNHLNNTDKNTDTNKNNDIVSNTNNNETEIHEKFNKNRIDERFNMGLSHLDDFEYLKTMNEYPINKNMLYAIKGFKTIYKDHEPMFSFEQEFYDKSRY